MTHLSEAQRALASFALAGATLVAIPIGHINTTYRVEAPNGRFVLQRLNPIFDAKVNLDIEALTQKLAAAGLVTPHLVRTKTGQAWHTDENGDTWRLLTYVDGEVFVAAPHAGLCAGAGFLLGRFHRALAPVTHTFAAKRLGVHDTPQHVQGLEEALRRHDTHPARAEVAKMATPLLAEVGRLLPVAAAAPLPRRIVHGDAKLSNVIFAPAAPDVRQGAAQDACTARALIDLDTLAHMEVHLELGDALRSWCNPAGEGPAPAQFLLPYLEAAVTGYSRGAAGLLRPEEVLAIVPGIYQIALELCVRFLRDALEERYFAWDRASYAHAWQHQLVRARSQWACFRALKALGSAPQDVVGRAFGLTA